MASTSPSTDAAGPLRSLVWLATAATTVTAAWLIGVSIAVLPERDPARVGFWVVVAAALLGFAALTAMHLARWGGALVRWLARAAGLAATVAGAWLAITTLAATGEFEGYLLLIGIVVAAHGALVTLSATRG
jgi:hypothetical protein